MKNIFALLLLFFTHSCEQIIEVEDISNASIIILAPSDGLTLDTTVVSFSWQGLDYAENYHLQIVKPNFNTTEAIVEDTLITATNFTKVLAPDTYQWRIKAKNFSYETPYSTQNLTIED